VFVKGSHNDVKRLCSEPNGLSFVLDRSKLVPQPMTATDEEINSFRIIAQSLAGRLPVILASQVDLADGDQVEVITGPFQGLGGTFHPRQGSSYGTLTVTSGAGLTALVTDIHVSQLRVVKFADMTKRPYDIIDAFTPRLMVALRSYGTGKSLDAQTIAPLISFTRRLDGTGISNPKLDAKLQLHLLGAYTILGDRNRARQSRQRYEARREQLTNPQTLALAYLITGIIDNDHSKIKQSRHILKPLKSTAANKMLQNELNFWDDLSSIQNTSI